MKQMLDALRKTGWGIDKESPLELRDQKGEAVTGRQAQMVWNNLASQQPTYIRDEAMQMTPALG